MSADLSCFDRALILNAEWSDELEACRCTIAQRSSAEIWSMLGTGVENFRDKLVDWMNEHSENPERAFLAAKTFSDLVNLPGSAAYGARAGKSIKALAKYLNKVFLGSDEVENKKQKRRSDVPEEHKEDWENLLGTLCQASDELELEEVAETLIAVGMRIKSEEALEGLGKLSSSKQRKIELLRVLLKASLLAIEENDLRKGYPQWLASALQTISKDGKDFVLAFVQRIADRCNPTTQRIRNDVCDLCRVCLSSEDADLKLDMQTFCAINLVSSEKSTRRALGIELLATLVACTTEKAAVEESTILNAMAVAVLDPVPTVRCSALRAMSTLASAKPFVLTACDGRLVTAIVEAVKSDENAGVRRWAVKVLALCPELDSKAFDACVERCRDVSLSVRKAAVEAVGSFIQRYPSSTDSAFSRAILRLVKDQEKSVSETALAIISNCVLSPSRNFLKSVLPLLYCVKSDDDEAHLGFALKQLQSRPEYAPLFNDFLTRIAEHAIVCLPSESEANRVWLWSTWLVLAQCAGFNKLPSSKLISGEFLRKAWSIAERLMTLSEDDVQAGEQEAHTLQRRILQVCEAAILLIPDRVEFGNCILRDLAEMERPPQVCDAMLKLIERISRQEQPDLITSDALVREWGGALKQSCIRWLKTEIDRRVQQPQAEEVNAPEQAMSDSVSSSSPNKEESYGNTQCALFLLGQLSMIGFTMDEKPNSRLVWFGSDETQDESITLVQAMVTPELGKSHITRAFAISTLGKLCLRDQVLAKRCVSVFVRELACGVKGGFEKVRQSENAGNPAIRINCLMTLGDLCRRFTDVVEPFIEKIARSLGDVSSMVRKRAVLILGALLQEEYVKMRPYLFYRLMACIGDENEDVAETATFILTKGLLLRHPSLFYANASSLVFAMNALPRHIFMKSADSADVGEDAPCLVGCQIDTMKNDSDRRDRIYKVIFSKLEDAQKLEISNKIRREVLGGLLEGTLSLEHFNVNVPNWERSGVTNCVVDTLRILESDFAHPLGTARKTTAKLSGADGLALTEDGEETTDSSVAVRKATAKIIEALEKKNVADNVTPLIAALYETAAKAHSSLVKLLLDHLLYLNERFPVECSAALAPFRDIHALVQLEANRRVKPSEKVNKVFSVQEAVEQSVESTLETKAVVESAEATRDLPQEEMEDENPVPILTKDKTPKVSRRARRVLMGRN